MTVLVRTPLAKALGWTLVHSLWEGALIAILAGAALLLCRPASARIRYALACAGLLAALLAFAATLAVLWPAPATGIALPRFDAARFAPPLGLGSPAPPAAQQDRLPWIVPFWMAGVLLFYVRTAGGWFAAQRMRRRGVVAAPDEWQLRLRALAASLRISRPVALLESCLAEAPVLIGFLRPAILAPAGLLAGLAPDQIEAILLHELAHIRRHDYAVNLLQSLVEGLLFYHPAVWWLSRMARVERENCCDDAVVAIRGDAAGYAAALTALEERRALAQPALAANGGNLVNRVRRLLEPKKPSPGAGPLLASLLLLTPVAAGLLSAWPAKPQPFLATQEPAARIAPAAPAGLAQPDAGSRIQAGPPIRDVAGQASQTRQAQLSAQAQPLTRPLTGEQKQANEERLAQALQTPGAAPNDLRDPYRKWLLEDVAYIIDNEERGAFLSLKTNDERERFIEQFWQRRDPTPGTVENEFKEEHYRRIAFANDHFASADLPGWKSDRGRIYIQYGPPDSIDNPRDSGGGALPYQVWTYRFIEGIGQNVVIRFKDLTGNGWYVLESLPKAAMAQSNDRASLLAAIDDMKAELAKKRKWYTEASPEVRRLEEQIATLEARADSRRILVYASKSGLAFTVRVGAGQGGIGSTPASARSVTFTVPIDPVDHGVEVYTRITDSSKRRVLAYEEKTLRYQGAAYRKAVFLEPGGYRADIATKDTKTGAQQSGFVEFRVE
ncbi:MAG TPA: GWxTD domain-containing protein [Bryobacteraceae bacterium]|nr:GWxTD domain-containing protein [Bryobacteraceae bacterium]